MRFLFIILFCFTCGIVSAQSDSILQQQVTDSVRVDTTVKTQLDTVKKAVIVPVKLNWRTDTFFSKLFSGPLISPAKTSPVFQVSAIKPVDSKDEIFYVLLGALTLLALIKTIFPRYIPNMFRMFFQSSFRQKQTRDQLLQETLPSLLMNLFFVIIAALFITTAAKRFMVIQLSYWQLFSYAATGIAVIYIIKYLFLLFAGWVFNVKEPAHTYGFIVFLVNKIIGIVLLPLLFIFAFGNEVTANVLGTITVSVVVLLFIYRYIIALTNLRGGLRVNAIHFFIYLCAVELAPLLVIYKLLSGQVRGNI